MTPTPTPAPAPAPLPVPRTQYGVDVSGWQTVDQVKTACGSGKYGFVGVKATEGYTYKSPTYVDQVAAVRAAGLCVLHFHFSWQNQDPVKEAEAFLAYADIRPGDIWAVDVESWDQANNYAAMQGVTWDQRLDYVLRFGQTVEAAKGGIGSVYPTWDVIKGLRGACGVTVDTGWASTPKWAELTRRGLWVPEYYAVVNGVRVAAKPGQFSSVNGGWDVLMHQYTDNDNGLDGDYLPDVNAWTKYAVPA